MLTSILKNKLLWVALLPPVILLIYIYIMDKKDRESPALLMKIFLRGVTACIPSIAVEFIGEKALSLYLSPEDLRRTAVEAYFVVAFTEEIFKYIAVRKSTWYSYEYNYRFDGIVYAVFGSLGFAAIENIMYVFNYGLKTGIFRAVLAIPGHMMFGVFMGIFYGKSKELSLCGKRILAALSDLLTVAVPVVLHGTYDYLLMKNPNEFSLAFTGYVFVAYIITFNLIRRYSRNDYHMLRSRRRPKN